MAAQDCDERMRREAPPNHPGRNSIVRRTGRRFPLCPGGLRITRGNSPTLLRSASQRPFARSRCPSFSFPTSFVAINCPALRPEATSN